MNGPTNRILALDKNYLYLSPYSVSVVCVSAFLSNTNSLSALALTDSLILGSATTIDETIPEEPTVEVGDTSYAPLESPSSEALPPVPPYPGEGVIAPLDLSDPTPVDLDAQIEELESELEKCKTGETNHKGAPPGDVVDVTDGGDVSSIDDAEVETAANDTVTSSVAADDVAPPNHQRGLSVCRGLTIAFFVIFTVMVATLLFVLESEMDVPVLTELRQMPELQHFKRQHYNPMKTSLARRAGRWFK